MPLNPLSFPSCGTHPHKEELFTSSLDTHCSPQGQVCSNLPLFGSEYISFIFSGSSRVSHSTGGAVATCTLNTWGLCVHKECPPCASNPAVIPGPPEDKSLYQKHRAPEWEQEGNTALLSAVSLGIRHQAGTGYLLACHAWFEIWTLTTDFWSPEKIHSIYKWKWYLDFYWQYYWILPIHLRHLVSWFQIFPQGWPDLISLLSSDSVHGKSLTQVSEAEREDQKKAASGSRECLSPIPAPQVPTKWGNLSSPNPRRTKITLFNMKFLGILYLWHFIKLQQSNVASYFA